MMRNGLTLLTILTVATLTGCAGQGAAVRLTPTANNTTGHALSQQFEDAYAVVRPTGEIDVVLTGAPVVRELQQVMHLRILWKPMRGTKADQPSTTNAVIDWSIFDPAGGARADLLRYSGAGFVHAYRTGDDLQVKVRNATLKLADRRGGIDDPIGPATLTGTFTAKFDGARVDALLASVGTDAHAAIDGR